MRTQNNWDSHMLIVKIQDEAVTLENSFRISNKFIIHSSYNTEIPLKGVKAQVDIKPVVYGL